MRISKRHNNGYSSRHKIAYRLGEVWGTLTPYSNIIRNTLSNLYHDMAVRQPTFLELDYHNHIDHLPKFDRKNFLR